jgi:transposase
MHNDNIINLLKLEEVIFEKIIEKGDYIELFFKRIDKRPICSCGSLTLHIHDWRTQTLVDLPIHGKAVRLIVSKQRYRCTTCKKRITSDLPFVRKFQRITNRTTDYIVKKLKKLNFTDTSIEIGVSITSVMRKFKENIDFTNLIPNSPRVLHIDEFKGTSDAGKYQVAICNGDNNKLYDILPDRNQASLISYFSKLDRVPEICVIDMWLPFKRAIKKTWKDTIIIADKFHYVRQIQWAVKSIRIRVQEYSKKNKILKKYWKLFATNVTKLSKKQIKRLKELLKLDVELKEVYTIKAYFDRYVTGCKKEEAHENFDNWLDMVKESKIPEIKNLEKPFENWYSEVVASFYYDRTNALAEGINNKIKVIKRQSYGIRKFENLRNLLMLRIS